MSRLSGSSVVSKSLVGKPPTSRRVIRGRTTSFSDRAGGDSKGTRVSSPRVNVYARCMAGKAATHRPIWAEEPTLQDHLGRIQGYLHHLGLAAFPASETPLRRQLADFMEQHLDE